MLRKRRRAGWYVGEMSPARREHDGPPLRTAVVCRSIAQHTTTTFFPHFVGDARSLVHEARICNEVCIGIVGLRKGKKWLPNR